MLNSLLLLLFFSGVKSKVETKEWEVMLEVLEESRRCESVASERILLSVLLVDC